MQPHFDFQSSDIDQTQIQLVSLSDSRSKIKVTTAINNPDIQGPSIMAFAGARYSRSNDSIEDIYKEIKNAGSNAQEKLANIFRKYGHASVADMSQIFLYIENLPQILATKFFNETSLGGGQERSTRYQDFGNLEIENIDDQFTPENQIQAQDDKEYKKLNQEFKNLQKYSLEKYAYWRDLLMQEYPKVYDLDPKSKAQKPALKARVFDSARGFLLSGLGNRTSLAWVTSAREWSRIISSFKADSSFTLNCLAEQLEELLAPSQIPENLNYLPEAPDLIRYTKADENSKSVLKNLYQYLQENPEILDLENQNKKIKIPKIEIEVKYFDEKISANIKVLINLILSIYPSLNPQELVLKLSNLSQEKINQISSIVFSGFDHHSQMPPSYRVNVFSYQLDYSIAEARDLNRHRAWGRTIPLLDMRHNHRDILKHGYSLPLYLTHNPDLKKLGQEYQKDLEAYYELLQSFLNQVESKAWFEPEIIKQILPFAHTARMFMHASPKELSYMTMLRVRPGGHINYRDIAYQIAKVSKNSNPWLSQIQIPVKPDPASTQEFIDRS